MDLTWLEDFVALAASGSFSRAAEARHVTQPAFSRRIRALEDWAGVPLFDRSAHPAHLTEAGQRFQPLAEDLVKRLAVAREATRAAQGRAAATLRFAATHALSLSFFPGWLRALEPSLTLGPVQLQSDTLQACEALMIDHRAQFLLCHHHAAVPGRLDGEDFRSCIVGSDTLLPLVAPDDAGRPRFVLGDTGAALPLLDYSAESGLGRIFRALRGQAAGSARLEPAFTSHLAVVLKSMALDQRGIAWLPESLVGEELDAGRLVEAGEMAARIKVEIRLFRHASPESAAAETFWQVAARPA